MTEAAMPKALPTLTPEGQLFGDLFNASPIGIAAETLDGQILFVNPAFSSMLGFSEEELRSKRCVDFSPPEDAEKDWALFQQLRAGFIDHYQLEKRYFRRQGSLVWGNLSISLLKSYPSPLVLAIVQDVTAKKTAEEALLRVNRTLEAQASVLQSREELLGIFVKKVPAGVAMLDREMRYLQVSDRFCSDYSLDPAQVLGRSHYEVFPDVPDRWKEIHRRALEGETLRAEEDRWDREEQTVWVRWEVRPWRNAEGPIGGIVIFAEDITRRKQMEEALSSLSRKLIESQEQERARIGRELHDDISQRLSMLAIELEQLRNNPMEISGRLQELREEAMAISVDVQALSHELHASKLEYLGVVSGMKSWCREFGERQKMKIEFSSDVSSPVPFEIGLSLFRVLQEALHNIVKHSGVDRAEVQLLQQSNEIQLRVKDSGRGFDVEEAKRGHGLGLTSMKERLQMVEGLLSIESRQQEGTTVHARVPLNATAKSAEAGRQAARQG
jgi:PAS domain S-box-containing protein